MAFITTLDIMGLTAEEYRAIVDRMGVEKHPGAGIYAHIAGKIEGGYRITEIWDHKEGFQAFLDEMLYPAAAALGIQRETTISVEQLHNIFAPRLEELPALADNAPGGPNAASRA